MSWMWCDSLRGKTITVHFRDSRLQQIGCQRSQGATGELGRHKVAFLVCKSETARKRGHLRLYLRSNGATKKCHATSSASLAVPARSTKRLESQFPSPLTNQDSGLTPWWASSLLLRCRWWSERIGLCNVSPQMAVPVIKTTWLLLSAPASAMRQSIHGISSSVTGPVSAVPYRSLLR